MAPSKHSVRARRMHYAITVYFSKCKSLVAVVGAFPGTESWVFYFPLHSGVAFSPPALGVPPLSFGELSCPLASPALLLWSLLQSCPVQGPGVLWVLWNSPFNIWPYASFCFLKRKVLKVEISTVN